MTVWRLLRRAGVVAGSVALMAGCDLGPPLTDPRPEVPAAFMADPAAQAAPPASADWWRGFHSPELDSLIDQARRQNFDIAAAIARVRQADAQVRIAGAPLLPSLNATGNASWQQASVVSSNRSSFGGSHGTATFDLHNYNLGLNAAYELDFWSKVQDLRQSAVANAMFSRFDQQTVTLTVTTDVASTWFNALGYADQLVVARQNLADAEQVLDAVRGRLQVGTASALDVAQQETLVANQRAVIPGLTGQMEQFIIGLGILVGRPPEAINVRPGTLDDIVLPPVAPGLPSELLERRPDVASAEAQLLAQDFNVKAARAAFFPQIQLTGSAGFESAALNTLFQPGGVIAALAAGVTQPIFDAGALRGELEQAKGRQAELLADYRKAVLQAFTDVDDALTAWRYTTEQEGLQREAVAAARRAADIARAQMQVGTVDINTVLLIEQSLFNAQAALAQARLARVQALLGLYKALGGGWVEPEGPVIDQFPGLSPGILPGGVALPVGGNVH